MNDQVVVPPDVVDSEKKDAPKVVPLNMYAGRQVLTSPIILGQPIFASPTTQTTVGAAGGASALPATPTGYIQFMIGNTQYVFPFYAVA